MAKKKSNKRVYDSDGRWVQEKGQVKGAIRRIFRQSPMMQEALEKARVELPPATKKDGTPGKRPRVRYRCAICGNLFPKTKNKSSFIQVDHVNPVVPLNKNESDLTYDDLVNNIMYGELQVVCSVPMKYNDGKPSCHKKKTDEENWIRRKLAGSGLAKTEAGWEYEIQKAKEEYRQHLREKENGKRKSRKRKSDPPIYKEVKKSVSD